MGREARANPISQDAKLGRIKRVERMTAVQLKRLLWEKQQEETKKRLAEFGKQDDKIADIQPEESNK